MIHRILRICRIVVSFFFGLILLLALVGGVLFGIALQFSSSMAAKPVVDDRSKTDERSGFRGVKLGALLAVAGLVIAAVLGGFIVTVSGIMPIAASSGHWPITEWFLQFAMRRSISTHSLGIETPPLDDPELLLKGATHYEIGCRPCHGSPELPLPRISAHMTPHPPDLRHRVDELQPRELFYVVKHGVKFTGMPAWPALQRDDEVWAVVAFLKRLTQLDGSAYRKLVGGDATVTPPIDALGGMPAVPLTVTQSCVRCHGIDGVGRGEGAFPKLAGQRQRYLENALTAYSTDKRHSGTMGPISAGLEADAIVEVARYYARLAPSHPAASSTDQVAIERGKMIAEHGIPEQRVPSCLDCHSPEGGRYNPNFPALEGQHADYLVLQLELFKKSQRGGSEYAHLMEPIARRLQPDQMRDVARYFESLRPRPTEDDVSGDSAPAVSKN